jgi:hypothetical protein
MDYIKTEERLISAQAELKRELKQTEILSSLDSVANKLQTTVKTRENLSATMKTSENLSTQDKLELPLQVKGRLLGIGRHKFRYYTEEELRKAVLLMQGRRIPFKLDHRRKEVSSTIGTVFDFKWDDNEKAIVYKGQINDETHARNILDSHDNLLEVSAGIDAVQSFDPRLGLVGKEVEFGEVSLVHSGGYKGNSIEPVV